MPTECYPDPVMRRSRWQQIPRVALALVAAGAALCAGTGQAWAQPAAGRFLIATKQVQGGFAESVILLIDVDSGGAMGLIVNHPTKLPLAKLLPDVASLRGHGDPVYLGGPVQPDHLMLLIRSKTAPPGATHVTGDVYASGSAATLRALAGKKGGATFRAYVGYAGWAPGQLESEVARGDWLVAPSDADSIFSRDPAGLWHDLIRQRGGVQVKLEGLEGSQLALR